MRIMAEKGPSLNRLTFVDVPPRPAPTPAAAAASRSNRAPSAAVTSRKITNALTIMAVAGTGAPVIACNGQDRGWSGAKRPVCRRLVIASRQKPGLRVTGPRSR